MKPVSMHALLKSVNSKHVSVLGIYSYGVDCAKCCFTVNVKFMPRIIIDFATSLNDECVVLHKNK